MRESKTSQRAALTLVELLVVITIIGLLGGLIMAASSAVLRVAKKSECQSLLITVEATIGQFADRYGAIPLATWGADPAALEPADEWSNRLFARLGRPMTKGDRDAAEAAIPAAMAAAAATVTVDEADAYKGGFTPAGDWRQWTGGSRNYQDAVVELLQVVRGEAAADAVRRAHLSAELIAAGKLGRKYLAKADPADAEPSVILDPWGAPLVYVSRYAPAVPFRDITTLDGWSYRYDTDQVGLPPGGRETIVDLDGDGSIDDEAAASDIRSHAFPGFELTYELWSAGPDGRFNAVRGHPDNDDNVTVTPYRHDVEE